MSIRLSSSGKIVLGWHHPASAPENGLLARPACLVVVAGRAGRLFRNLLVDCRMMKIWTARLCLALAPIVLNGCVKLDSGVRWAPDSIKEAPPPPSTEPPENRPNLDALIRDQATSAFPNLKSIRVSEPTPDGAHWQFCARVTSSGVAGGAITKTYLVKVVSGSIEDRRAVSTAHFCTSATFRPIAIERTPQG